MKTFLNSRRMMLATVCLILYTGYVIAMAMTDSVTDAVYVEMIQAVIYLCIGSKIQQSNAQYT